MTCYEESHDAVLVALLNLVLFKKLQLELIVVNASPPRARLDLPAYVPHTTQHTQT